jgi:TusA-related sulfurtransferase
MKTLDITADVCPITYVRTKIALESLAPGEQLEVVMRQGEPSLNVPRSLREDGHEVLAEGPLDGGLHRVVVRRATS